MASDPPRETWLTSGGVENINKHHVAVNSYVDHDFFDSFKRAMLKQMERNVLCDTVVKAGPKWWVAHACILAANSSYLHELVTQPNPAQILDLAGKPVQIVELNEDTGKGVPALLNYFYTGELNVSLENVRELMSLSTKLCIGIVPKFCSIFMQSNLNENTWFFILNVSKEWHIADVTRCTEAYVVSNLAKIVNDANFLRLNYEEVKPILESCKGTPGTECLKLDVILKWVNFDNQNRHSVYSELLNLVNATQLEKDAVATVLQNKSFMKLLDHPNTSTFLSQMPDFGVGSSLRCLQTNISQNEEQALQHNVRSIGYFKTDRGNASNKSEREEFNYSEKAGSEWQSTTCPFGLTSKEEGSGLRNAPITLGSTRDESESLRKMDEVTLETFDGEDEENSQYVDPSKNSEVCQKPNDGKNPIGSRKSNRKRNLPKRLRDSDSGSSINVVHSEENRVPSENLPEFVIPSPKTEDYRQRREQRKQKDKGNVCLDHSDDDMNSSTCKDTPVFERSKPICRYNCDTEKVFLDVSGHEETHLSRDCMVATTNIVKKDKDKKAENEVEFPFFTPARRKRHKKAVFDSDMYHCDRCPRKFETMSSLKHHQKGHGSDTPLLCETCGFKTKHIGSMRVHKRQHNGEKFRCSFEGCDWVTVVRSRLEDHYSSHEGVRKHSCSFCGKTFIQRKHLHRHEKMHTDQCRYVCTECEYKTARNDKFKLHMRKHHVKKAEGLGWMTEKEKVLKCETAVIQKENPDEGTNTFDMGPHVEMSLLGGSIVTHTVPCKNSLLLPIDTPVQEKSTKRSIVSGVMVKSHTSQPSSTQTIMTKSQSADITGVCNLKNSSRPPIDVSINNSHMTHNSHKGSGICTTGDKGDMSVYSSGKRQLISLQSSPALSGHDYALSQTRGQAIGTGIMLTNPVPQGFLDSESQSPSKQSRLLISEDAIPPRMARVETSSSLASQIADLSTTKYVSGNGHVTNSDQTFTPNLNNQEHIRPRHLPATTTISDEMIQYLTAMSREIQKGQTPI